MSISISEYKDCDWSLLDKIAEGKDPAVEMAEKSAYQFITEETIGEPYAVSAYRVDYAADRSGEIVSGVIGPNQVIPIWACKRQGKGISWNRLSSTRMTQWSAIVKDGKIYCARREEDAQDFDLATHVSNPAAKDPANHLLMAPGGRVQVNLAEQFPWGVPFAPINNIKVRTVAPMSAPSFWEFIKDSNVKPEQHHPQLMMVALVPSHPEGKEFESPLTSDGDGNEIVSCIPLPIPVGFGLYGDLVENSPPGDPRTHVLKGVNKMLAGMTDTIGETPIVGLAWFEEHVSEDDNTSFVYATQFDPDDALAHRRMASFGLATRYRNSSYYPEI